MWLNNSLHFGLRGVNEYYNLKWGDATLKTSSDGREYLELNERTIKTRTGGDIEDIGEMTPKINASAGNEFDKNNSNQVQMNVSIHVLTTVRDKNEEQSES